jgi:4-amino-4-deoxy-L-arabinose transferase-like glycosyltransferase
MLKLQSFFAWCDTPRHSGSLLFVLLVVSFAGKVALRLLFFRDAHYWQSGYSFYFRMAETYLQTGTLCLGDPNTSGAYYAFRPPLYPLLIAVVCRITNKSSDAFVVCEALISTLTVALVYGITLRVARPHAALLSAFSYAFYPYSFVHDTQLQENVLYNALSLAAFALFVIALDGKKRRAFFLAGIASGAAVLTRTSHLAAVAFFGGTLLLVMRHQPGQACRFLLAFALGVLLLLGPWMVRNKWVAGHFNVTSETGFALARAHNDYTFQYYPYRASIDDSWGAFHKNLDAEKRLELDAIRNDEFACGNWYSRQAQQYILGHPLETIGHGFYKVAVNFLGILSPLQEPYKNWVYSISYWLLTLPAVYGLWRVRETSFFKVFLAMILAQVAISFVFWAHTSHRSALDPLFAVAAGIGLAALVSSQSRMSSFVKNR